MSHRIAVLLLWIFSLIATPVLAQKTPTDQVIASLLSNGYIILTEERTWLGRQRIVAENGTYRREIVFNPATGEIFRDYTFELRFAEMPDPSATRSRPATGVATQIQPPVATTGGVIIGAADPIPAPEVIYRDPGVVGVTPDVLIIGEPTN